MEIGVFDHRSGEEIPIDWLEAVAARALPRCLATPGRHARSLPDLAGLEISLLDDEAIARVNVDFLGHEGPTDVVTFDHGEILIGVGVAQENARTYGKSLKEELALYIVHGLLHLNGWEDKDPREAAAMSEMQEAILAESTGLPEPKQTPPL